MDLSEKEQMARERLCLPLDELATLEAVGHRVDELSDFVGLFKVGKELFTRFGPQVIRTVQHNGANVFLDLKYHDIPNTVKEAARAATELGVSMFNVHTLGGLQMMQAALTGAQEASAANGCRMPTILGVTVLTSIDEDMLNNHIGIPGSVQDTVLRLARQADEAGLHGVVCSAAELGIIRKHLREDFMCVTPGIKAPDAFAGSDQKRLFTPGVAVEDGANILVVGRAISGRDTAEGRRDAARSVLQAMVRQL